jgi:hypothetical protein
MEQRFAHDFSNVRVHADERAAQSAAAVNARAYTLGSHTVFGANQFAPQTTEGRKLLAHELTHVVQQQQNHSSASETTISSPGDVSEQEADRAAETVIAGDSFRPAVASAGVLNRNGGGAPADLSGLTATRDAFNNTGAPHADNCAASLPAGLGIDGPATGENGMEMIFEIHGAIPAGTEFEITRTKATGTWQRNAAGAWSRLGGDPAGTSDDRHDDDECHTPRHNRIFVVDMPSVGADPTGVYPDGSTVDATATAVVRKHSMAEWVIARNRSLGIDWTPISRPLFHRWHSIISVELVGGTWTRVDTPSGQHNEIEPGSITTTGSPP